MLATVRPPIDTRHPAIYAHALPQAGIYARVVILYTVRIQRARIIIMEHVSSTPQRARVFCVCILTQDMLFLITFLYVITLSEFYENSLHTRV